MNERRKIARAIADTIELPLLALGATENAVEGAVNDATTAVMNALGFEDED